MSDNKVRCALNLPKKYLSYSAIDCWLKSPKQYRQRYYEKSPFISTPEINFGKEIGEKLENKDTSLDHIKQYSKPEHRFEIDIEGIPVMGFIDSYCPDTKSILEYKTSRTKFWTPKTVAKHKQLDLYSLAIEMTEGEVNDDLELIWMETEKYDEITTGLIPSTGAYKMRLTGEVKTFPRTVTSDERQAMRDLVIEVAHDISKDYTAYLADKAGSKTGLLP